MASPFPVDNVSDVVCPRCVIGDLQHARAAGQLDATLDLHWHPFELNPHWGTEGVKLREPIATKYGTPPEDASAAHRRLTRAGAELGFSFNYTDEMRTFNTLVPTMIPEQRLLAADAQGIDNYRQIIGAWRANP